MRQTINRGALIAASIVPLLVRTCKLGFWWFVAAAAPFLLYVSTMTDGDGKKAEETE
nr:hypothetical protein [Bacillus pumilus]